MISDKLHQDLYIGQVDEVEAVLEQEAKKLGSSGFDKAAVWNCLVLATLDDIRQLAIETQAKVDALYRELEEKEGENS